MVEKINQEKNVEVIFITGDFIEKEMDNIDILIKYLKQLKSNYGIYGCLGNHDYKRNHKKLSNILIENDINILINEQYNEIPNLEIIGLHDYYFHEFSEFKEMDFINEENENFRIVLSHNPNSYDKLKQYPFHLMLSGHSHGGQICFPFPSIVNLNGQNYPVLAFVKYLIDFFPKYSIIEIVWRYASLVKWKYSKGLFKNDEKIESYYSRDLYTNRGIGSHPPTRLNCNSEITVFTLNNN
eukprot:gene3796-6957_t